MRDFFSLDGTFNRYGSYIADTFILSLLWIVFSLPIVTVGASTTAMFYVATRRIANREGYISTDFWTAFKANFKKATIVWMVVLVIAAILVFNITHIDVMGDMAGVMYMAQLVLLLFVAMLSVYIFPILARFDMGIIQSLKSSFFMALRHLFTTMSCLFLLFGLVWMAVGPVIVMFLLAPGIYGMVASYFIMRVFRKYRPDIDPDPMVELQAIESRKADERRLANKSSEESDEDSTNIN